jgi:Mg-chelatase subunit ChlD
MTPERTRRWRLILGEDTPDSENPKQQKGTGLSEQDAGIDQALQDLYDQDREGGLADSKPDIARWLGDIRTYFPASVVRVMQQDALERLNLKKMLLQPELLQEIEPDVELVATLMSLRKVMPRKTLETARQVVQRVVDDLKKKLENPLREAIAGTLNRAVRNPRPRFKEINWGQTIQKNLKHYQPDYKTVVPEQLVGYGHKRNQLRDIVLLVDQSGSMAGSVVYAGIFAAVIASIPAVKTHLVAFDTNIADLTEKLQDPVEVLFGIQLGGGTDINRAVGYAQTIITRPQDTIVVLITDLYEGGNHNQLLQRVGDIVGSGAKLIVLLALNDKGAPSFNRTIAAQLVELGVPSFACTPDLFPDMMAAALNNRDIRQWAGANDIVVAPNN